MRKLILSALLILCAGAGFAQRSPVRKTDTRETLFTDPHRVTFTPFSVVTAYGEANPGIGLSYEYILGKTSGFSLYLPVAYGFQGPDQEYGYGGGYGRTIHTSFHAAPGVRFHTGEHGSRIDFATGLGVLVGNMHFRPTADYNGYTAQPYNYGLVGFVTDNSLNICRGHFMFGFDARIGIVGERNDLTQLFLSIGMHFGGKF